MIKVTISTITERGVLPQFYQTFKFDVMADEYVASYRKMAAQAGIMIRVDREMV